MWFPDMISNPEEEAEFLKSCCLVLDANAWLDLYRIGPGEADAVLGVIETLLGSGRLHTPNQVIGEFVRNQANTERTAKTRFVDVKTELGNSFSEFQGKSVFRRSFFHQTNEFRIAFQQANSRLDAEDKKFREQFQDGDPILDRVLRLLEASTGIEWAERDRCDAIDEGKKRYERNLPPGTADIKKKDIRIYGDWFLWKQTMDRAKGEQGADTLLITSDMKFDWYEENPQAGRTELISEFAQKTGKRVWITPMFRFLKDHIHKLGVDAPILDQDNLNMLLDSHLLPPLFDINLISFIPDIDADIVGSMIRAPLFNMDKDTFELTRIGEVELAPATSKNYIHETVRGYLDFYRFAAVSSARKVKEWGGGKWGGLAYLQGPNQSSLTVKSVGGSIQRIIDGPTGLLKDDLVVVALIYKAPPN
jgi:hypothetical protein